MYLIASSLAAALPVERRVLARWAWWVKTMAFLNSLRLMLNKSADEKRLTVIFFALFLASGEATIENVNHCIKAFAKLIENEKIKNVALPRLATGVGGLDRKEVKPVIEKHLGHLSVPIYVYSTYEPGVQTKEE